MAKRKTKEIPAVTKPQSQPKTAIYTAEQAQWHHGEKIAEAAVSRNGTVIAYFPNVELEPTRCKNYADFAARAMNACETMKPDTGELPPPDLPRELWVKAFPHYQFPHIFTYYIMGQCSIADMGEAAFGDTDNDLPTARLFAASPRLLEALKRAQTLLHECGYEIEQIDEAIALVENGRVESE